MEIYVIGGAVRDVLLGIVPNDLDYVVVGATEDVMINLGFESVGKDFPVFLHPSSRDEYALARRERKTGVGYGGFATNIDDVSLEEDTARRDLTVNSLAVRECDWEKFVETGAVSLVIDHHNGVNDLIARVLRNVTDAFKEDPVRTLRVARFRARLGESWTVAERTIELIMQMHAEGEYLNLTRERVWKEVSRAMMEPHAHLFIKSLIEWSMVDAIIRGVSGPIGGFTTRSEFEKLKTSCVLGSSLPIRLAMAGFSQNDLRLIKADTDIHKFVAGLYQVVLHFRHMSDGVQIVAIFNAVKAYQNIKNYEWLLEAIHVLHGEGAKVIFERVYESSKLLTFADLSEEIRLGDPKKFKDEIDKMRSTHVTGRCEGILEQIRVKHPDWVAEAEQ